MYGISENDIEQNLISQLILDGYQYFSGVDIGPGGEHEKRKSYESVILENDLFDALVRLNPTIPENAILEAINRIKNLGNGDLISLNMKMQSYIRDGIDIEYFFAGEEKSANIILISDEAQKNDFLVVNQFTVIQDGYEKRPDVVIFINGLPVVLIELKDPLNEKADLQRAFNQIQNYKKYIPNIFLYNQICVISDGIDAKASSLSAPFSRYLAWKKNGEEKGPELEILAKYMLEKSDLIKLIKYNIVFEKQETKDEKGIFSTFLVKKIASYHQFYAVQKAVKSTLEALQSDGKIGTLWHTQGSGKSLSMVFYVGEIVRHIQMQNPTVVVLTDRNDLDDQLFQTFSNCIGILRQSPIQANSREHLKNILKVAGGGIIFTTIQKFYPESGNVFETLSERKNIVVIADEAHRSQYGFGAREKEDETGSNIKYGNAKYLRDALPNASFIGFTGTPIEQNDKSTRQVFGQDIDIYDISQAVKDGATVPISYESRLSKVKIKQELLDKIDEQVDEIPDATAEQKEKAKKNNSSIDAIIGNPDRLNDIANDIIFHFEQRKKVFEGKAMIVCNSRSIAIDLFNKIVSIRPSWKDENLMKGKIKVVITSASDDEEKFWPHKTSKQERKNLATRFKDPNDNLEIVIVQSMWLTGFDVPCLNTMYIDKKMQGANLMQAIARVNRVYKDKPGGLIVDYIGIGQELKKAMAIYTSSGGKGNAVEDIEAIKSNMSTKYEIVSQMFHGKDYKKYFFVDSKQKLNIILELVDFLLGDEKLKERFLDNTTKLSKAFAMASPCQECENIRDEVALFQGLKTRINKLSPQSGKTDRQVDEAVRQIIEETITSDGIIDIFQAAGMKSPSLDILSPEFLQEVKNIKQKNIALELLKKLLNEEIKTRKTVNLPQAKKFSELLESSIKRYHNNQIDTAQVIKELCEIANQIKLQDIEKDNLKLSSQEYAFYSVLSENESTKFLEDEKMRELIYLLVETVRKNATIDRYEKENTRAFLRIQVKKLLMKYGYPPDLARIQADKIIEQSENIAKYYLNNE